MGYLGIVMVVAGGTILIWVRSRNFNRTNQYGTQEFKSFGQYAGKSIIEGIAKLVAIALVVVGALLTASLFN